ncbi:MAG TPA: GNAT family N-acetyltransferase [Phycisphaerae bacterium]|nr:GNAT family N-acetyltransferase [Phycisphaerae bacterium]
MEFRQQARPSDEAAVREIVSSTGFFSEAEVDVAVELVQERLRRGDASGYFFLFAEIDGRPVGYACYGPIACTIGSYDLYWIAVHKEYQHRGLGRALLLATERKIWEAKGRRIYVETSSRPQYRPTREFYAHFDYRVEAELADFYAPGDGKIIYSKAAGL